MEGGVQDFRSVFSDLIPIIVSFPGWTFVGQSNTHLFQILKAAAKKAFSTRQWFKPQTHNIWVVSKLSDIFNLEGHHFLFQNDTGRFFEEEWTEYIKHVSKTRLSLQCYKVYNTIYNVVNRLAVWSCFCQVHPHISLLLSFILPNTVSFYWINSIFICGFVCLKNSIKTEKQLNVKICPLIDEKIC